jgi:hypothetical protein
VYIVIEPLSKVTLKVEVTVGLKQFHIVGDFLNDFMEQRIGCWEH